MSDMDKDFLEFVIKSLVDHPEDVNVGRTVDEMGVLMTLDVNPEDMGKVIGRNGATAKAIRTLLRVVGMKNQARVNLKINEPEGSTRSFGTPPHSAPESSDDSASSSVQSAVDEVMNDLKS